MKHWMLCTLFVAGSAWAALGEDRSPIDQRFAAQDAAETPDFRQHIVPLLGRLGCNGRACHGAFQGQGGFRLSLFGYDFKNDLENIAAGETPRVNKEHPEESLALKKPLMIEPHDGGQRFEPGSWQHRVLANWIKGGAIGVTEKTPEFVRLEVTPAEFVANQSGEGFSLKAYSVWSDGTREDVTPLCRFQTNNDEIATVDEFGRVSVLHAGDTHVVVFYDNGVVPVEVLLPVSEQRGDKYPTVATPTKIDELVVSKLRKLGVVPSEECTDAEFLRRVSLDMTGTLPTPQEVQSFLADPSPTKRAAKIDELLERPGYAAWWATKFCDYTGNQAKDLNRVGAVGLMAPTKEWFEWIRVRIEKNMPYDEMVAGIVTATSRREGESYDDYCARMSGYYRKEAMESFASQDSLTHYWARRNFVKPEDRALGFAYSFLGVRIQCAQCHKHPFDQWTKDDFDRFTTFFGRVAYGDTPQMKNDVKERFEQLGLDARNLNKKEQVDKMKTILAGGQTIPFRELYVVSAKQAERRAKNPDKEKKKKPQMVAGRVAKYLGGEEVKLEEVEDPRELLMNWLRDEDNPYFAKAIVNRVWAGYFQRGIVEAPDDLSLANPPSNAPLLDYLATEFRAHNFDLKWLHRTIANSRTYQLSWRTNETNERDHRNFSHAELRRLPAEVALDAIFQATASDQENAKYPTERERRSIVDAGGNVGKRGAGYALTVFGRSVRESNCDCDRSMEASLLQTVYLQNDDELLNTISRKGGWLEQLTKGASPAVNAQVAAAEEAAMDAKPDRKSAAQRVAKLQQKLKKAKARKNPSETEIEQIEQQLAKAERRAEKVAEVAPADQAKQEAGAADTQTKEEAIPASELQAIITQAYLRSLSRYPEPEELARAEQSYQDAGNLAAGTRDLVWALLNTKEFLLNH